MTTHTLRRFGFATLFVATASCSSEKGQTTTLEITRPICGNGIPEAGEVCDDGNTRDGDECSSTCGPGF